VVIADGTPQEIKARVGGKRVSFTTNPQLGEDTFAGLPCQHLHLEQGRVSLITDQPELLLKALFYREVEMRHLEVVGADLEEAFLNLTGRDHRASASPERREVEEVL
jgi:ABC-2 type transport system ATP-binding protein